MSENTHDSTSGVESDAAEPSMEDILASIRRIIDEDDAAATTEALSTDSNGDSNLDELLLSNPLEVNQSFETNDLVIPDVSSDLIKQ